jgi:hypothetical protein
VYADGSDNAARVASAVLDLRLALRDERLRGERRQWIEADLQTVRLARAGIRTRHSASILARYGVTRTGRRRVLRRGPETWGSAVHAHVAPPG